MTVVKGAALTVRICSRSAGFLAAFSHFASSSPKIVDHPAYSWVVEAGRKGKGGQVFMVSDMPLLCFFGGCDSVAHDLCMILYPCSHAVTILGRDV